MKFPCKFFDILFDFLAKDDLGIMSEDILFDALDPGNWSILESIVEILLENL